MTPPFPRLEVIDDPQGHGAAFNMAADEALLDGLGDTALLRLYRWQRPSVSFGYFDHAAPVLRAFPDRDLVRRWTGGGVVEHGEDFTYSLLVPRTDPLTSAPRAEESYRVLHEALAAALAAAGAPPPSILGDSLAPGAAEPSRACFVHAVRYDLLLTGHKIAGAAQRRTRRGWLHQGSVLLPTDAAAAYPRLGTTLPAALGVELQPRLMRPDERSRTEALARQKYASETWLRRV